MFEIQFSKEASKDLEERVSAHIAKKARRMLEDMRSGDLSQGNRRRLKKLRMWASSVDQGSNAHRILWSKDKRNRLLVVVHRVVGHDEYERLYK